MLEPQRDKHANIDSRSIIANKKSTETLLLYFLRYNRLSLKSSKISETRSKKIGLGSGFFAQERDSMLEYLAKTAIHPRNLKTFDLTTQDHNETDYQDIGIEHIFSEFAVLFLNRRTAICTTVEYKKGVMLLSKLIPNLTSLLSLDVEVLESLDSSKLHLADVIATTLLLMNFDIHHGNVSFIDGIFGFVDHGKSGVFTDSIMNSLVNLFIHLKCIIALHLKMDDSLMDPKTEVGETFIKDLLKSILNKTNISRDFIEILINRKISDLISIGYELSYLHECFFYKNKLARELFNNLSIETQKNHLVDFITETLHTHFRLLRAFALSLTVLDINGSISVPEKKEKLKIELTKGLSLESLAKAFEETDDAKSIRAQSPFTTLNNLYSELICYNQKNLNLFFKKINALPSFATIDFKSIPEFLCSTTFRSSFGRDFNEEEKSKLIRFAKKLISNVCEMKCEEPEIKTSISNKKIAPEKLAECLYEEISQKIPDTKLMLQDIMNSDNTSALIRNTIENIAFCKF